MNKKFYIGLLSGLLAAPSIMANEPQEIYSNENGYIAGEVIELNVPYKGTLTIAGEMSNVPEEEINSGNGGLYSEYVNGEVAGLVEYSNSKSEDSLFGFNVTWYYYDIEPGIYYYHANEDFFFGFRVTITEGNDEDEFVETRVIYDQYYYAQTATELLVPFGGTLTVIVDGSKNIYEEINNGEGCIFASLSNGLPTAQAAPSGEPTQTGTAQYGYSITWTYEDFPAGVCYFYNDCESDHVTIKITGIPEDEPDDPEGPAYTTLTPKIVTPYGMGDLKMLQLTWQGAVLSFNENERPSGSFTSGEGVEYICEFAIDTNTSLLDVTFRDPSTGEVAVMTEAGEYALVINPGGVLVNGELNKLVELTYTVGESASSGVGMIDGQWQMPASTGVYNLYGVKVADTLNNSLPAGIYVVNGEKVLVK